MSDTNEVIRPGLRREIRQWAIQTAIDLIGVLKSEDHTQAVITLEVVAARLESFVMTGEFDAPESVAGGDDRQVYWPAGWLPPAFMMEDGRCTRYLGPLDEGGRFVDAEDARS